MAKKSTASGLTSRISSAAPKSTAGKIALGATGLVLATGAIAAGIALSDKKTRTKLGKTAKNAATKATDIASMYVEQGKGGYQAFGHQLAKEGSSSRSTKRGRAAKNKKN